MHFVFFLLLGVWAFELVLITDATPSNSNDEGDENACSSYVNLPQASRLETHSLDKNSAPECDDKISEHHQWFRFVGDAGTRMPESCVSPGYCGTISPGWMRGKHPTLNGEIAIREICFPKDGKCCGFHVEARVKLCGEVESGFYVYKLRSIPQDSGNNGCNRRYCGTKIESPCESYKVLEEADRNEAFNSHSKKSDSKLPLNTWYRFKEAAGTVMPNSCVPEGYCGTKAPGWLWLQKLPSQNKNVKHAWVCYHVDGECCKCKNQIAVKNCGGFYIYKLTALPKCSGAGKLRYCATSKQVDPCASPTILTDADRLESFNGYSYQSDANIVGHTWYRFTGAAGYKIPESCVPEKHCGTGVPGWLQGKHPQTKKQMVHRQICYHHKNLCCKFSNEVPVINCGGYYVYKLMKPPTPKTGKLKKLKMRYCGLQRADLTEECTNYKILSEATRSESFSDKSVRKCDKKIHMRSRWYRFKGEAGTRMSTSPVAADHCGTRNPGWMMGSLPDISMNIVERKVCFRKGRKRCHWTKNILVRNCGDFYVFHLPGSPKCTRYCGADTPETDNKWSNPKGCYKDKGWSNRALPILYSNQRKSINWAEYPLNSKGIVEHCAVKARAVGFLCFGIQFWGECWGHKEGCSKYHIHGKAKSKRCEYGLGKHWTNFVYTAKCGSNYGCCDDHRTPRTKRSVDCPECHSAVDLMLVVDSSDSINPANFDLIRKDFITEIVKHFTIHEKVTNVAILQYADTPDLRLTFKASRHKSWKGIDKVASKMKRLNGRGITHTGAALEEAYNILNETARQGLAKRVLVLTNGKTNDTATLNKYVHKLKQLEKIKLVVVGVFPQSHADEPRDPDILAELKLIASSPEDVFYERSFDDMMGDLESIKKRLCPE